jgi:hypothetical protein
MNVAVHARECAESVTERLMCALSPTPTPSSPAPAPAPSSAAPTLPALVPCVHATDGHVTVGGDLSSAFRSTSSAGCVFRALQVSEAPVRIDQLIQLTTGTFAVMINCSAKQEIASNVITIPCTAHEALSSGRCVPETVTCGPAEVRVGSLCKRQPRLRVLSDGLALFVTGLHEAVQSLPVRLTLQGGFDVDWNASVGAGAAEWLVLQPDAGQLAAADGPGPAATVTLQLRLDATKQTDFSIAGDLRSTLTIEGHLHPQADFEGQSIVVPVRMRVEAQACVRLRDVQVQTGASERRSVDQNARVGDIWLNSRVVIYVRAYDSQRSPIQRSLTKQPLRLRLGDGGGYPNDTLTMAYAPTEAEKNLHEVTLPRAWVNISGEVRLVVFSSSNDSAVASFTLVIGASKRFPIWEVAGAVVAIGLVGLLLCLIHILRKNRAAANAILKAYMRFEFLLGMEMSKAAHCPLPASSETLSSLWCHCRRRYFGHRRRHTRRRLRAPDCKRVGPLVSAPPFSRAQPNSHTTPHSEPCIAEGTPCSMGLPSARRYTRSS